MATINGPETGARFRSFPDVRFSAVFYENATPSLQNRRSLGSRNRRAAAPAEPIEAFFWRVRNFGAGAVSVGARDSFAAVAAARRKIGAPRRKIGALPPAPRAFRRQPPTRLAPFLLFHPAQDTRGQAAAAALGSQGPARLRRA